MLFLLSDKPFNSFQILSTIVDEFSGINIFILQLLSATNEHVT